MNTLARVGLVLLLSLLTTLPALSQNFPFQRGSSGSQFGIGDVISIIGATRGNGSILGGRGPVLGGNRRNDKLQTVILIGGALYELSRNRNQSSSRDYPTRPYPDYPGQPTTYPDRPEVSNPGYYPEPAGGLIRPDGYDAISYSGRTLRLDPSILPLSINPGDRSYQAEVQEAVRTWNSAGLGQLFEVTHGVADLTVDWSGSRVSSGARAETRMATTSRHVVPTDLSVRTSGRSGQQLARVLTHELGHVLGLDHSNQTSDVMYRSEQSNRPLGLTARDRQMLHWLYSQQNYLPVLGRTDIGQMPSVASRMNATGGSNWGAGSAVGVAVCRFHNDH